jgi:hypothetical protein
MLASSLIFAEDIKDLEGRIIGEDMWVAHHRGGLAQHGFNHLNYFVSANLWWDIDQDIDKLLDEYYSDFYGPAADEMKAFVNYYERHQDQMSQINSADIIKTALDLFDKAQAAVDPDSVYGKRLTMFSEGLERRRKFYAKIKDGRENPPLFAASKLTTDIKLDGKLDKKFWSELPGELKQIQTGEEVKYPTRFKIGVKDNYLYFGLKCFDEKGDPVNIAEVDRKDHNGLWNGDAVELLLETAVHSYYQIAINPAGTICDLDRSVPLSKAFGWGAEADVFTQINKTEGYWTIEARVPFTPSTQDPLHEMIGPRPSKDNPWYFNICRQRVRDEGGEVSAFSPTGERRFHNILKFGKLIVE